MKVKWSSNSGRNLRITCTDPGRWEAQPQVAEFKLHHRPVGESPDRLAVAATLLFGRLFNGMIHFPGPVNLVTASAIRDFCYPGEIFLSEIDEGPKTIITGSGSLLLSNNLGDAIGRLEDFSLRRLVDLPSSTFTGALASHRLSVVASNSFHFDLPGEPNGSLAVATLLSASLDINVLKSTAVVGREYARRVNDLLASVGLGVEFGGYDG